MARIPTLRRRKWTRQTAAHLALRAGLGPIPSQVDLFEKQGLEETIEGLLSYAPEAARNQVPEWFHEEEASHRLPKGFTRKSLAALPLEERRKVQNEQRKRDRQHLEACRVWWMERMVNHPHPLEEKLSLFWHGHFATSVQKVKAPYPMLLQNVMLRERGLGSWPEMIAAVSKDPAMLVYLDNARSSKRKPNENYARELMELFTLGEGHYTEEDIRNAARAFAGWSVDREKWEFEERARQMDLGRKNFMGESGRLNGQDIIDILVKQPEAGPFLADKLWRFFASETPNRHVIEDISRVLKESDFQLSAALRGLFSHEDFYHPSVIRSQIKSPVQLTVQLVRTLNATTPPGKLMSNACRQLGQILFEPPSVKGWDGGAAWITASTLSLRYKFAGRLVTMKDAFDPDNILPDRSISRSEIREHLFDRFYHSPLREKEQINMDAFLATLPPAQEWQRRHFVEVLKYLTQQPQYQLT